LAAIVPLSRKHFHFYAAPTAEIALTPVTVVKETVFRGEKSCNTSSIKIESIPVSALVKMFQSGEKL
jgi:hypothetical protein